MPDVFPLRALAGWLAVVLAAPLLGSALPRGKAHEARPNLLLCIADDWGYPHAGCYGDRVVRTPNIDALAKQGVVFEKAFVSSPSCTPSRGAILAGQWHWRLGPGANLWCELPADFTSYVDRLAEAGYHVGYSGKGWGPGRWKRGGNPAGPRYRSFQAFLRKHREAHAGEPFCFWLGTIDPHRPYRAGSGRASGLDVDAIQVPACYPNVPVIREDIADYYFEVGRFDRVVGDAVKRLKQEGLLENTVIVVTGDHGMPFPRGKSHLYDLGTRVPLIVSWPKQFPGGRRVTDFVSLCDLAPTFLALAHVPLPEEMTGRSLLPQLTSNRSGRIDPSRSFVLTGKERHVPAQEAPDRGGYPCRAIRTDAFLYIRNYRPDRWPSGTPHYERAAIPGAWLADTDNGPTKSYLVAERNRDARHKEAYELAFGRRPAEELYDLRKDPAQRRNVAGDPAYAADLRRLRARLTRLLKASGDPREMGGGDVFDTYAYLGGAPRHPSWKGKRATPRKRRQSPARPIR